METSVSFLAATAVSLGFFHTLLGPDHYLPFIVLSRARNWSVSKTMLITFLCGMGHVLSSFAMGLLGITAGISLNRLVEVQSFRGSIAGWLFIAFGLVYLVISLRNLARKRSGSHGHFQAESGHPGNEHNHNGKHLNLKGNGVLSTTPWILFLIFVFGPCEPLIPVLMYPAAQNNVAGAVLVAVLFSAVTIATMMSVVLAFRLGLAKINLKPVEKFNHVIAGGIILFSGIAIQFLGL